MINVPELRMMSWMSRTKVSWNDHPRPSSDSDVAGELTRRRANILDVPHHVVELRSALLLLLLHHVDSVLQV